MTTFKRICVKNWEISDEHGSTFKVERGKEYLTSGVGDAPSIGPNPKEDHVIVFSNFWVPVPVSVFAGGEKFT